MVMICNDCEEVVDMPDDVEVGDIISCPCCGLEYEVRMVDGVMEMVELTLDGLDYGE
jgi:hypothetical protein